MRTLRRLRVGRELRALRRACGLNLEEAAKLFGRSDGSLSKIENGQQRVFPRDLHAFFAVYNVTDEDRKNELMELASRSLQPAYPAQYGEVVRPSFADYLALEQDAVSIMYWGETIPGLFQTRDYAIQVVESGQIWQERKQVEKFVDLRLERQTVLTRVDPAPPKIHIVMGERALLQRQGNEPAVHRKQLEHLVTTAGLPNVSLQVLPFTAGPHPGDNGPFTTMTFAQDEPPVAVVGMLMSAIFFEEPSSYQRYEAAGEQLRMAALSPRESLAKITTIIEELA
ncbi:helix-turn-helix domain-containing protein [Embleya sp. AB8]|uniref:helix-turn-helix domain-containing protein n=1 Tax=Embleya sp. AB8 TaxID=3156304 RepID=UPI003C79225A